MGDIVEVVLLVSIDLLLVKYFLFDVIGDDFVEIGKLSKF